MKQNPGWGEEKNRMRLFNFRRTDHEKSGEYILHIVVCRVGHYRYASGGEDGVAISNPQNWYLLLMDLVMGETLEITFDVTGTDEGMKAMNEDVSIKLSANYGKRSGRPPVV